MVHHEKLVDALIADLKVAGVPSSPQGWAALRKRLLRVAETVAAPAPSSPELDRLYTTHDVARMLQVDPSTVAKWIEARKLVAFKTPGGHRRIRAADFEAFRAEFGMPITGDAA